MKTFSSFIKEVAEPLAGDEKKFKAKHVFVKHKELAPPATKDDKVFNASNKTRAGVPSGYNNNKDVAVYEDTATHEIEFADKPGVKFKALGKNKDDLSSFNSITAPKPSPTTSSEPAAVKSHTAINQAKMPEPGSKEDDEDTANMLATAEKMYQANRAAVLAGRPNDVKTDLGTDEFGNKKYLSPIYPVKPDGTSHGPGKSGKGKTLTQAAFDRLKESNEEKINEESLGKHNELAKYAKEHGGIDKETLINAALHIRAGDIQGTKNLLRKMDTDPRDLVIKHIDKKHHEAIGYNVKEEVEHVDEAINPDNYTVTTELSKFKNGGHRPHIVDKEGHTMYLGGTTYKSAEHAKGHAKAYLHGYAQGGEIRANRNASEYQKAHTKHIVEDTEVKSKSFLEAIHEAASKPLIQMEEAKVPAAPIVEEVKKETKKHTSFASAIRNTLQS